MPSRTRCFTVVDRARFFWRELLNTCRACGPGERSCERSWRSARSSHGEASVCYCGVDDPYLRLLVNLRLDEDIEQRAVEVAGPSLVVQDVERFFLRDALLVGAIAGGERVVDVGDRHHPGLNGDLVAAASLGIAGAVELLVVRAGDLRDASELPRPRDPREEFVGVDHVGLYFLELRWRETAPGNREDLCLLARDDGLAVAQMILEEVERQALDAGGEVARQHGRLVGRDDAREVLLQLGDVGGELGVEGRRLGRVAAAALLHEVLDLLAGVAKLETPLDQLDALADTVQLARQ